MLRLLTFGGLRVAREDGSATDLSNQRRRLAVLVVVAASAPTGVPRERLIFLLWPDAEADKGRHALNQIVYNLRRELGTSPIDGAAELTLLREVMTADLLEFRAAIARGDHESAAELYTGPFLDGFFVPGATEFERWAEDERTRTMRQAISAMEKLAAAAEASNDAASHVRWTQRLVELDPLSARRALSHMRALEHLGDRDAAIAYGRRYQVLAQNDGDDVDPVVGAEVERLRALPTIVRTPVQSVSAMLADAANEPVVAGVSSDALVATMTPEHVAAITPVTNDAVTAAASAAIAPLASNALTPTASDLRTPDSSPAQVRTRGRRWPIAVALGALIVTAAAIVATRTRRVILPMETGDRFVLADVQLPPADSANARALAFALQSALQQSSRVRFVSPVSVDDALRRMGRSPGQTALPDSSAAEVAEREGARYVVSLSVTPAGSSRSLSLRVLEPASRNTLRTYSTITSAADVLSAIDRVAAQMRSDLGDTDRDIAAAIPLPRATTPSLEALRMLAGARIAFNRALYNDARTLYEGALTLDSGFAMAHAELGSVAYVMNDVREGDARIARALALSDRLPTRERLLIQAAAARGTNDWARAATLHRAYLIRYPYDFDMYDALGYDLMRSRSPKEATAAYDTFLAHRPPNAGTMINIAQVNTQLGRFLEARKAQAAALRLDTAFLVRVVQNERFGATLLALGFADSARLIHSALLAREPQDQARGQRLLAYVDLYEGRYASAIQHLKAAINLAQASAGTGLSEIRDRDLLAGVLLDLGRTAEAREQLAKASSMCLTSRQVPQALFWTGKPLARLGEITTARLLLDSARARARKADFAELAAASALEAEISVAQGRFAEGIEAAQKAAAQDSLAYIVETHAYALEQAGRPQDARVIYVTLADQLRRTLESEGQQKAKLAPLSVARMDLALGRVDDARKALGAFMERWPTADANLPMITTLRARINAASGPR